MVNDRLHRLKIGAIDETRKLFGIFIYLWVLLSLFSFHKALVLNEEYVIYDQGFALINALALAKVILIGASGLAAAGFFAVPTRNELGRLRAYLGRL
jgi:hypothetical protein